MDATQFQFEAPVWLYSAASSWHFVALPPEVADDVEQAAGSNTGGFGSVRVEVTIGTSVWRTSLFPDSKRKTYLLPLKKPIRAAQGLEVGSVAKVRLQLLHPA